MESESVEIIDQVDGASIKSEVCEPGSDVAKQKLDVDGK